ncbi:hypothetical protein GCM10011491_14350 [Brucella endophytica]|uniref:Uncharacterized protein n=1 Tax=Brucella endophytica TaxID=1963359 RepID=A0A916WD69_9HYPH|nr:hypothetical protein [Brucella endophytica]GGA87751.1 hypothetical protein GCM10011491_14350 [Brucella endophytica]
MRAAICMGLAALSLASINGAAHASSSDAWAEFNAKVTRACIAASGIRNPRPSRIVAFDDRAGMAAMLVQDRTRGSSTAMLCLYNKKTKKAYVGDADAWSAPPPPR